MYKIISKGIVGKRVSYYFENVFYPKRRLIYPNLKINSNLFYLKFCQNCGAILESKSNCKIDSDLSVKGICSVCGFNHSSLPELKSFLKNDNSFNFLLLNNSISTEINVGGLFYSSKDDTFNLNKEWYGLAKHLFERFGYDGLYGLVCWLKGKLPKTQILFLDKKIIQVLLYLKKLTGVYFNPITRGDYCV